MNTSGKLILGAIVILGMTFVVYIPAIQSGFVWDDDVMLTENKYIAASDGLYDLWLTTKSGDYFPLTSTMLWIEWRLFGMNATGYHMINVILHALSAVLIWRVLWRLGVPGAYVAAAIFSVHPVAVDSVAWIAERKNTLSMLFFALSMLAYVRFDQSPRRRLYAAALVTFALALSAKPSVVMMPVVLLGLAWWRRGRISRADVLRTVPFFALSFMLGLITLYLQNRHSINPSDFRLEGFFTRLAVSGWCVGFYLYKTLLPINLSSVYPLWKVDPMWPLAWVPLVGLVTLTAVVAKQHRSPWARLVLATLAYFVVMLLPVLGFANMSFHKVSLVANHLQYVGLIGPIVLVVAGATVLLQRSPVTRQVSKAVAIVVLVLLAGLSWQRARIYESKEVFWRHTLRANPKAWLAHYDLGSLLSLQGKVHEGIDHLQQALQIKPDYADAHNNLGLALESQGKLDEAISHFNKVIQIDPEYAEAHSNLGLALQSQGKQAEAIFHCRQALQISPHDIDSLNNLGKVLSQQGKLDEAASLFRQALEINPHSAKAHSNLGYVLECQGKLTEAVNHYRQALDADPNFFKAHTNLGGALFKLRRPAEAISHYRQALQINPNDVLAHYNFANALLREGHLDEAIGQYRQALEMNPNYADAHNNLGVALKMTGRLDEALKHFRQAVNLKPADPNPWTHMAWILATHPDRNARDPNEAVRVAEHVSQLTGRRNPLVLDTLAAAYAAAGQFDRAIATAQEALQLASAAQDAAQVDDIRKRLELYQQAIPYRQPVQRQGILRPH